LGDVTHHSRLGTVVIDVPAGDLERQLAFWRAATGQSLPQLSAHPEYHGGAVPGGDVSLLVQRLAGGPARVHLDIHTDDLDAEVARLEALGATRVRQVHSWWVMRDPAGLAFCVVPDDPGTLNERNALRWD
jgi:predicted enzyme related to lactoylglutathione lyase